MAKDYYSEYGSLSDYSEEYTADSDINRCEVEQRYRWYKEDIDGQYFLLNYNDNVYPYLDSTNTRKGDYSEWQNDEPVNIEQREVLTRDVYEAKKMQPIRYIYISELYGNFYYFRITELQVFNNDQSINYSYFCDGCNSDFGNYIHNNRVIENMAYIKNWGYMRIDLGDYYDAANIVIKLSLYDVGPDNMNYKIKYTKDIDDPVYFMRSFNELVINDSLSDIDIKTITIDDLNLYEPEWQNPIMYLLPQESTPTINVIARKQYRYRDTYFYYYRINRSYLDGYYADYDNNYIKDIVDYKDYYRCQKRDKVTLAEDINITNYNQSLKDFIYENTTNQYQISGTIDFNTNGIYEITYIFPFISINKKVVVNILDNDINILMTKANELQIKLEQLQKQLNEQILISDNNFKNTKEELLNYITNINSLLLLVDAKSINQDNNQAAVDEINNQLDVLIEKMNSLDYTNDNYLTTLDNINYEKDQSAIIFNNIIAVIDQLNADVINGKIDDRESINNLLNSKINLEAIMTNLNNNLDEQVLVNSTSKEIINSLTEQINNLKNNMEKQTNNQMEFYHQKIMELNSQIIKQNQDLKDIVNFKKEEATKYQNNILKLNELLKIKEDEINKLMSNTNKEMDNYNVFDFKIDYLMLVIVTLIAIFIVLIRFLYKKNVELK